MQTIAAVAVAVGAQNNIHNMPRASERAAAVSNPFLSSKAIAIDPKMMAIAPKAIAIQRSHHTLSLHFISGRRNDFATKYAAPTMLTSVWDITRRKSPTVRSTR